MEDYLQGAIDPALQEPETAVTSEEDPLPGSPETPARTATGRRRKTSTPKDPESVFRRKEANRLAAERSRIRASEKSAALQTTYTRLADENRSLKAELMALGVHEFGEPGGVSAQETADESAVAGDTSLGSAEDENHSRNILAALMKDAGIHVEEGDEASWMQGVENFIKEAESSGRLGDLAAVAAGSDGDEGAQNATPATASASNPPSSSRDATLDHKDLAKALGYTPGAASEATLSALAVALNSEIEKVIRDDYAATKTAIMQIEAQIAALQKEGAEESSEPVSIMGMSDNEENTLAAIEDLQSQLPQNRAALLQEEEEKVQEENKLAAVVEQLLGARGRSVANEKERLEGELRTVPGFIGSLLATILTPGDLGTQRKSHLLDTPLSSPALAHRKRGRPRKGSTPLVYQQAALYRTPQSSSGSSFSAQSSPAPPSRGKGRKAATQAQSRLRESISASNLKADTEGLAEHTEQQDQTLADSAHELDDQSHVEALVAAQADSAQHSPGADINVEPAEGGPVNVLSRFNKGAPGSCSLCGRTETSAWRKVIINGEGYRVCNACGLYHSKFGVLRPSDLWGDGKGIRKRRSGRPSGADEGDGETSPRKKLKGEDGEEMDEGQEREDLEELHDLDHIAADIVAEAVASASAHATPGAAAPAMEGGDESGEIVVDEDLQKSFEQLTRHLEQQSRAAGSSSLSGDVFNV